MSSSQQSLKPKVKGSGGKPKGSKEKLFGDFVFVNPEVPARDFVILNEISEQRQIVKNQIDFKRRSYQK